MLAEGQLDEGRAGTQKIQLEEEETERLRAENGELRAEVEKIKAAKKPAKIIAAGAPGASFRRRRRRQLQKEAAETARNNNISDVTEVEHREQGGTAIRTSISMPLASNQAAGSAAAAIRQLVRCLFFFF